MSLPETERALLLAAARSADDRNSGFCKCDQALRVVLQLMDAWTETAEIALCNTGYEAQEVGKLYDQLRSLVERGLLQGRGDLKLPAGPRYTECGITPAGSAALG